MLIAFLLQVCFEASDPSALLLLCNMVCIWESLFLFFYLDFIIFITSHFWVHHIPIPISAIINLHIKTNRNRIVIIKQ